MAILLKRADINVDFIWDILHKKGKRVKALNVPFVVPPYTFNVDFKPIGFGLPTNEKEWNEEFNPLHQPQIKYHHIIPKSLKTTLYPPVI